VKQSTIPTVPTRFAVGRRRDNVGVRSSNLRRSTMILSTGQQPCTSSTFSKACAREGSMLATQRIWSTDFGSISKAPAARRKATDRGGCRTMRSTQRVPRPSVESATSRERKVPGAYAESSRRATPVLGWMFPVLREAEHHPDRPDALRGREASGQRGGPEFDSPSLHSSSKGRVVWLQCEPTPRFADPSEEGIFHKVRCPLSP